MSPLVSRQPRVHRPVRLDSPRHTTITTNDPPSAPAPAATVAAAAAAVVVVVPPPLPLLLLPLLLLLVGEGYGGGDFVAGDAAAPHGDHVDICPPQDQADLHLHIM